MSRTVIGPSIRGRITASGAVRAWRLGEPGPSSLITAPGPRESRRPLSVATPRRTFRSGLSNTYSSSAVAAFTPTTIRAMSKPRPERSMESVVPMIPRSPFGYRKTRSASTSSTPPSNPSSTPSPAPPIVDLAPTSASASPTISTNLPPTKGPLARYSSRLTALSVRTGVPFPTLAAAFLVLHELTAVVPLIILYFILQALGAGAGLVAWLEGIASAEDDEIKDKDKGRDVECGGAIARTIAEWMREGSARAEKVGKRYGILGYDKTPRNPEVDDQGQIGGHMDGSSSLEQVTMRKNGASDKVASAITAYVIVKALLPLRIGASLMIAPAFARMAVLPYRRFAARWRGLKSSPPSSSQGNQ